jgi:hypothetical protein
MKKEQLAELVYQALETELGGVQIYATALKCVQNEDLKKEWTKYHQETKRHVEIVTKRAIVRHKGEALVKAMKMALDTGDEAAAELVAAECIVDAETKDHHNWELIGKAAEGAKGDVAKALQAAYDEVEDQEDEHLYHTAGWTRELWIKSLGLPAALPPPEEQKHVKSAIGAARAKHARDEMI